MKVFLVVGASDSWHASGYGRAILQGDAERVLVSFVEYVKNPQQSMRLPSPQAPYQPKLNITGELQTAIGSMIENHMEEIFDHPEESDAGISGGA